MFVWFVTADCFCAGSARCIAVGLEPQPNWIQRRRRDFFVCRGLNPTSNQWAVIYTGRDNSATHVDELKITKNKNKNVFRVRHYKYTAEMRVTNSLTLVQEKRRNVVAKPRQNSSKLASQPAVVGAARTVFTSARQQR